MRAFHLEITLSDGTKKQSDNFIEDSELVRSLGGYDFVINEVNKRLEGLAGLDSISIEKDGLKTYYNPNFIPSARIVQWKD